MTGAICRIVGAVAVLLTALTLPAHFGSAAAAQAVARDDYRPLVIVLDTSGSMADTDDNNTVKLAGAQAALTQAIRQQRPGSQMGLWTYGSGSDCAPGTFTSRVGYDDQPTLIRKVRGLEADGDTPTAEALRAVADDLSGDYEGATILLISDGESTCEDPCAAAQEITAQGFDLTVQAAGFQIDDAGMDELRCIADATGGGVYEATDSKELNDVVSAAATATLTLDVTGIPTRTAAGSASRVTVRITNNAAIDIEDARVSFDFAGSGSGPAVVPAVLPPLKRFGRIPAGQYSEYTWLVGYGTRGKAGTASYRISAWGTNAQPASTSGSVDVVSADQVLSDGGGFIKSLQGKRIAIVGDSYSAGEGAGNYLAGTDAKTDSAVGNQCHQSPYTYMYTLFSARDVEMIACSGAKTRNWKDDRFGVREHQVPLLRTVQERDPVDAAFMTIGGNDISFGPLVRACLLGHLDPKLPTPWSPTVVSWDRRCSDDRDLLDETAALLSGLPSELKPTYEQVYAALNSDDAVDARDGEIAPLYVLAYPQPFPERQWASSFCKGFDIEEIGFANDLVGRLNGEIEKTVSDLHSRGYRIHMVTTTQEAFLPDNTACPRPGSHEYLNSVNLGSGLGAGLYDKIRHTSDANQFMHPNRNGYRVETNTILAWSVGADESLPESASEWRDAGSTEHPGLITRAAEKLAPPQPTAGTAVLDAATGVWTSEPLDVRGGQDIEVRIVNAAPGTTVTITLHSRAQVIGAIEVEDDGTGTGTVRVPRTVPSGGHSLRAIAFDESFTPVVASQPIDVARAFPLWFTPLAAAAAMFFGLAWWFARRDWHTRTAGRVSAAQ